MKSALRWRVVLGCDEAGLSYKERIKAELAADPRVVSLDDLGVHRPGTLTAYPAIGLSAAERIAAGHADRAVLICGTGIGMAISANKVPGIRATTAHDSFSAERSVLSNDCQVLALGERVIGVELAVRLVREWLGYEFDRESASAAKVAEIAEYETAQATRQHRP